MIKAAKGCTCPECKSRTRQLAALSAFTDLSVLPLINELRVALQEHADAVTAPWLVNAGNFSDAFFPHPFRRFQLTGETPSMHDIAISFKTNAHESAPQSAVAMVSPRPDVVQSLIADLVARRSPVPVRSFQPIFIVGCGRSGTTLLTKLFACHPLVVDINEARAVWLHVPSLDIWSMAAESRGGKLCWPHSLPLDEEQRDDLRRAFLVAVLSSPELQARLAHTGPPKDREALVEALQSVILVEKLPENAFRIGLLVQLYPECKIVHLFRQQSAVIRSISKFSFSAWYGPTGYKWKQLHALRMADYSVAPATSVWQMSDCADLEWTLSQYYVAEAAPALSTRLLRIDFDELVLDTIGTWHKILSFAALPALQVDKLPALQELLSTVRREKACTEH